ncbi:NAD(P)/FAD-dependent oxidoreductase [Gynuella sunshinyii]|uniref:NADH dehydrogenase, FAD-containing subunit n=1 Tax=Gynuella sunshinyii YC6258 TaxID=1445510 RepID=A0A0C5VRU9_9GAMM|nr:NADH dehydrogenase, FAD-containing subunit [Gynuella sunshinyii YC6258]
MKIVVVGGGAGGLELATKLGNKLGKKQTADILLIDKNQTHLWKPLLHEVASGTMDSEIDAVSYRAHAHNHGFRFKIGTLSGINREEKYIHLQPVVDDEGEEILPERKESYDILVLAIGSISNDFGVQGIREHAIFLDSPKQAIRFQHKLVNQFIRINRRLEQEPDTSLSVAIVGGGATGVELSAELFNARHWFSLYGLKNVTSEHLKVTLVEAGPRLLPALSERIAGSVHQELLELGLDIRTNTQVSRAEAGKLHTADGKIIEADLIVWAAGVKAPDFLKDFGGLETNRINQIVVNTHLQPAQDESIYVIGDCAGRQIDEKRWVPPRAQSAHQMASLVYHNILLSLAGKPQKDFKYQDHGSLVSLSRYTAIGNLMGNLTRGSMNIEGKLARMAYVSLYRMHQLALHGWTKMILMTLSEKINKVIRPRLKLH